MSAARMEMRSDRLRDELQRAISERDKARADCAELRAALMPFARDDFCIALGGNVEGDASPVFMRNKSLLILGHFRNARALLAKLDAEGKS